MIGQTLGHYEIVELLGQGGMGQVYRARDTKLGREVAIKVLPREMGGVPERIARFRREARTLATLQHANVATIHGFEDEGQTRFLVMELVEGEDLFERLERGPVDTEEAIEIARQIAHGLEAAHEQGVVHRDLKPANVKLTPTGTVKILDFGLARAYVDDEGQGDPAESPTITAAMTQAGVVLGTAAYMSPEQARGRAVDRRSDIWSYGVMLFEMLSGQRLFAGETVSETMAEVMKGTIDFETLPKDTPRWLRQLLERCLERDPAMRMQSIGEARIAIERRQSDAPEATTVGTAKPRSVLLPWITAAVTLMLLAAALVWNTMQPTIEASLVRSSLLPPDDQFFAVDSPFAVSLDGTKIAFVATSNPMADMPQTGEQSLWVRDLAEADARMIPGTDGARYPFWSPDGRQLGFFTDTSLSKVDLRGGPAVRLSDAQDGRGGSWNEDGIIIFQRMWSEGLMTIPAGGGTPEPLTTLDAERSDIAHRWPQFLPDGRRFLFFVVNTTSVAASEYSGIYVGSLDSDETRLLVRGESRGMYSQGHLLYRVESTLMAHAVDEASMELIGDPVPIEADIAGGAISWGGAHFGVSSNGVLVSLRGAGATNSRLVWRDREGNQLEQIGDASTFGEFDLSNDGVRVAAVEGGHTSDIWIYDTARGTRTRFTFDTADDRSPVWSPDDTRVAFVSAREHVGEIYVRPVSGDEPPTLVYATKTNTALNDWSPDGRYLLYQSVTPGENGWDLKAFDLEQREEIDIVVAPFVQQFPKVSPDGKWLAFVSTESGQQEVYVQPFPSGTGRWMVSTDGGTRPMWAKGGAELLFFDGTANEVFAVAVRGERSPVFGAPEQLFSAPLRTGTGLLNDVTGDGSRFLVNEQGVVDRSGQSAGLIQNWMRIAER